MAKWISVDKRIPECEGIKDANKGWLVCDKNSLKRRPFVTFQHPTWWNTDGEEIITHWMDIPDIPK